MKEFNKKIQAQFDKMCATGKLFRVAMTGNMIWDLYLKSFKDSPIFRDPNSSVHNCNTCHNFIRRYGNVVAIDATNDIVTIFDDADVDEEMKPVAIALMAENEKEAWIKLLAFLENAHELDSSKIDLQ